MNSYHLEKKIISCIILIIFSNTAWSETLKTGSASTLSNLQGTKNNDVDLSQIGMIFKFEQQQEVIIEKIRRTDEIITRASSLITRSQATGNSAAEGIAIKAQQKAQENKRQLELKKLQIDKNIAYVRNRMADRSGINSKIGGMVTQHSGRVRVISGKPPYEAIPMDDEHPGYFEEGDTLETYGNSRADVQFLDGRGSMTIGEYSRVKMEKKDPFTETLSLAKGEIHTAVDKAEVFESWLEKQAAMAIDDPNKLLADDFGKIRAKVKKYSKKFEVRTPNVAIAVRGTTFAVNVDDAGATTLELIEGEVAVSNLKTAVMTVLKTGEKITISADGIVHINPLTLPAKPWWEQ